MRLRTGIDRDSGLIAAVRIESEKMEAEFNVVLADADADIGSALKLPKYVVRAGVLDAKTGKPVQVE